MGYAILSVWTAFVFAQGNQALARPVNADVCQNDCQLDLGHNGETGVFCRCTQTSKASQVIRSPSPPSILLQTTWASRTRLRGQDQEDVRAVAADACKGKVAAYKGEPRAAGDLYFRAAGGGASLCECVSARVHFPVERRCRRGVEAVCHFTLGNREAQAKGPLRNPTLEDYQSCLAQRANHPEPATCQYAKCSAPPSCGAGQEVFNVAAAGACCAEFECRSKSISPSRGGSPYGGSAL